MKRIFNSAVFGLVVLASMSLRGADSRNGESARDAAGRAAKGCTVSTLRGIYLLSGRLDAPAYMPLSGVPQVVGGLRTFDGAGNISGPATVNAGGTIVQSRPPGAPGVYTLNADCTGTMTNASTRHYDIFVAADGSEAVAVRTDPDVVEILRLKRISEPSED